MAKQENEITQDIIKYCELKNYFVFRVDNGSRFNFARKSYMRRGRGYINGVPDLIIIYQGSFVGVEVKTLKGKQSNSQKAFEIRCKEEGGFYLLVRSLGDFILQMKDLKNEQNRNHCLVETIH